MKLRNLSVIEVLYFTYVTKYMKDLQPPQNVSCLFERALKGRNKRALEELAKAGKAGCTPIKQPAPRWSAYIHNLRSFGVKVQTVTEKHGGTFTSNHGRYFLLAEAVIVLSGGM